MTVEQLIQLYAPLAGLLCMAFWTGVLSQRVKTLEDSAKDEKSSGERLVKVEVTLGTVHDDVQGIKRSMEGVQRQLGNLMTRGRGVVDLPAAN